MEKRAVLIYDTTLRDGAQGEQVNFTAEEKLRVARRLDDFGIAYIEGGWPGSNPKDMRFFELARAAKFRNARLAAFGSTRRAHTPPGECPNVQALLEAQTPTVTIFGKSWDLHVKEILKISMKENLSMVGETVAYLKSKKKEVIYDAEHFFDGYRANPRYALQTIEAAFQNGADMIVLCDTNGGTLPSELGRVIDEVAALIPLERLGIHAHNDGGVAVANSIAAVEKGVRMVQGTINGYGERCGNADLIPIMANLELKLKKSCLPEGSLKELTRLSLFVSEVANITPLNSRPFIGRSAFAHKGGIHVHAVLKNPVAYEHVAPEIVGNKRRVLVSDLSGRSNIEYKAAEMGLSLGDDDARSRKIVEEIKHLENEGYTFEAADGSLALIIRKATGEFEEPFYLECFRVINEKQGSEPSRAQALIKVIVGKDTEITAAEGNGPINALDNALRKALVTFYPELAKMHLTDFKVSILEGSEGTAAKVRVFIESRDDKDIWSTIGVSESVIEASWHALVDSVQYKLSKDRLNRHGREEKKAVA
jgi:2-isopropylmalate synthase